MRTSYCPTFSPSSFMRCCSVFLLTSCSKPERWEINYMTSPFYGCRTLLKWGKDSNLALWCQKQQHLHNSLPSFTVQLKSILTFHCGMSLCGSCSYTGFLCVEKSLQQPLDICNLFWSLGSAHLFCWGLCLCLSCFTLPILPAFPVPVTRSPWIVHLQPSLLRKSSLTSQTR